AGSIVTIRFLGLQVVYCFSTLTGIEESLTLYITIIVILVAGAAISAVTGLHRGIQYLSSFNVILAIGLIIGVLILGPAMFIFNNFFEALGLYVNEFVSLNTFRGDEAWLCGWTVFFFFWFTVVGGTGISQEINVPGSVSEALDAAGPPAAMMAITENLPLSAVFGVLFLIVTTVFVLTTTDSMSLTISMAISGDGNPPRW